MKKVLATLLIMAMSASLLVGCGEKESAGKDKDNDKNTSIDQNVDTDNDVANKPGNENIENGITIDGKMYDYHIDGILDSELELILPILAKEIGEDVTIEEAIQYLNEKDKEKAFDVLEEIRVENNINHINRIVLTSEDVDFAIEVVVNLDEVYMEREFVLQENYVGPAYTLALKRNMDKWGSDSDTFTIAFGKDEISTEDYIKQYIEYNKNQGITVSATEPVCFEAAGYTWERFNFKQTTTTNGIDKETLQEVTIVDEGYSCEIGTKVGTDGYLQFVANEDYLRESGIGEAWEDVVIDCILEINIIDKE